MKTIQVVLDTKLLKAADHAAQKRGADTLCVCGVETRLDAFSQFNPLKSA